MEFFAGANTRYGFKSLFDEAFKHTARLYILKGSSGCGKSTLMKKMAEKAKKLKLKADIIRCSADPNSLDGVIFPELGVAIADGTSPHVLDVKYPCVGESIINLGQFWDEKKLIPYSDRIKELTDEKSGHYKKAYKALAAAGYMESLRDGIIIECVEGKKLNSFVQKLFEKVGRKKQGRTDKLYASAFTCDGIKTLPVFENAKSLYRINGIGKKEVMSALRKYCISAEEETVISIDPVDPEIIDSIYFRESGILVTSLQTPPCAGVRESHTVSSGRFLNETVISQNKNKLHGVEKLLTELYSLAMEELSLAKSVHNEIEGIYIPAMDFSAMDEFTNLLSKQIFGE